MAIASICHITVTVRQCEGSYHSSLVTILAFNYHYFWSKRHPWADAKKTGESVVDRDILWFI